MSFSTLEDVNTAQFNNQGFWWHTIDTSVIDHDGNTEFTDVVFDFCKISKKKRDSNWRYIVEVDNSFWTKGTAFVDKNDKAIFVVQSYTDKGFNVSVSENSSPIKILLYMGIQQVTSDTLRYYLKDNVLNLNLKQLNSTQEIKVYNRYTSEWVTILMKLSRGFNEIKDLGGSAGFVLVKLLKTDFQFDCNQSLTVGKVNTVALGTLTDYLPNGDLIGDNTPVITVKYGKQTIPVEWNSQLNDYTFDLDLTDKTDTGRIRFKVQVKSNDVINDSTTDVVLESQYSKVNSLSDLTNLFKSGGTAELNNNITLTSDLTLTKSVYLIGADKTLNLNQHKIIIPTDKTFKAENTSFTNGINAISQNTGSKVELTNCTFTDCTSANNIGAVIDCNLDLESLDNPTDFNTVLTNCSFTDNDSCILHGGDLTVTGCTCNGKISNPNYPYFLYQTDGEAIITDSNFNLSSSETIETDIEFNTCIFTVGETAQINNRSHSELQSNDLTSFLNTQRNTSKINVTYYYKLIEDYITLSSDKGYCHSCSNLDYVFKTNITITREEQ